MSSDFEGYEQDFAVLTAEITNKIARVPRLPPGESPALTGRAGGAQSRKAWVVGDGTPSEQAYVRREVGVRWCWGPLGRVELDLVEGKGQSKLSCGVH